MKYIIEIDTDNAAFGESAQDISNEITRILIEQVIDKQLQYDHFVEPLKLKDINGNTIGFAGLKD